MERVTIAVDSDDPSPAELEGYFAELFASLDAAPRPLYLTVRTRNDRGTRFSVSMEDGEPVFKTDDGRVAKGRLKKRWLAAHPSPLKLSLYGATRLVLSPVPGGNRVEVRKASLLERLLH